MNNLKTFVYVGNAADVFKAEDEIDGILINPWLPANFFDTANEDRPKSHQKFWYLPFILVDDGRMDVCCLDGGAWDRPTIWGFFHTIEEALNCAKTGPGWRK